MQHEKLFVAALVALCIFAIIGQGLYLDAFGDIEAAGMLVGLAVYIAVARWVRRSNSRDAFFGSQCSDGEEVVRLGLVGWFFVGPALYRLGVAVSDGRIDNFGPNIAVVTLTWGFAAIWPALTRHAAATD